MKVHKLLWSGLAAGAVLFVSGAAFSGGPATTTTNTLVDYDESTHILAGIPLHQTNAVQYLHNASTVHLVADLAVFTPPDPCIPAVDVWNATVNFDEKYGVTSTAVFDILLTVMSDLKCNASVTSVGGTPANPIVAITPAP